MKRVHALVLGLALVTPIAAPTQGCESVGPNAHVGVVTAIDTVRNTLTLRDAETGGRLVFLARPDLIRGIAPKDEVIVRFAPEGQGLRATSIEKAGR